MILGIGMDMIEVQRVKKACEKEAFLTRCFTKKEQDMIASNQEKAAGNFASKEAVSKVFGTGFRGIQLTEIEVLRDEWGKPYVTLYGRAKELAQKQGILCIHITITNTKEYAAAYAIGEGDSKMSSI